MVKKRLLYSTPTCNDSIDGWNVGIFISLKSSKHLTQILFDRCGLAVSKIAATDALNMFGNITGQYFREKARLFIA